MTAPADQLELLAPRTGRQRKERVLSTHEHNKKAAILWLRKRLRELYNQRAAGNGWKIDNTKSVSVDADDARRIYEASSFPAEYAQNRTFFGSIFRGADWQIVSRKASTHPANNGREIKTWKYVGT